MAYTKPISVVMTAILFGILCLFIFGKVLSGHIKQSQFAFEADVVAGAFSPDGEMFAAVGGADCRVEFLHLSNYQAYNVELCPRDSSATLSAVNWKPDGQNIIVVPSHSTEVWTVDVDSHQVLLRLDSHSTEVRGAVYSPDSLLIASFDISGNVVVWNASSGEIVATLAGHSDIVTSVGFDPSSRFLVTTSFDKTAQIWDITSAQRLWTIEQHNATVFAAAFSPNGRYLVTGGADNTARAWDTSTHEELSRYTATGWVMRVFFSRDSQFVSMSTWLDGHIAVWRFGTDEIVQTVSAGIEAELLDSNLEGSLIATGFRNNVSFLAVRQEDR